MSEEITMWRRTLLELEESAFAQPDRIELIGDIAETGQMAEQDLHFACDKMLSWLSRFPDRERLLYVLSMLLGTPANWIKFSFQPLVAFLPELSADELVHALYILGSTFNRRYLPELRTYVEHSDGDVSRAASNAVYEIEMSSKP